MKAAPHLRLSEQDLDRFWVQKLPEELRGTVASIKITASSKYFLTGAIFLSVPDEAREGKIRHGKLAFKLVAARSFLSLSPRFAVKHFVSSITPRAIRRRYAGPFLETVLHWLSSRGFEEVCFPIHSRRRRQGFQKVIEELGFAYHLRNRILFQIVVVDLRSGD